MSPEQARGREVDARTDIRAFGCSMYEALTGNAPFAHDTASGHFARGLSAMIANDWESARSSFERAANLDPNFVDAQRGLGWYHALSGEFDESVRRLEFALSLDPMSSASEHITEVILFFARRYDEAEFHL